MKNEELALIQNAFDNSFFLNSETNYQKLAVGLLAKQPLYFDQAKIWWIWNAQEARWKTGDETDVFNGVNQYLLNPEETVKQKPRNQLLTALKQQARLKPPLTPPETWVQFQTEVYDIITGQHFPASPEYLMVNPLPWKVGDSELTPRIDELLLSWSYKKDYQDETYALTLYQIMAYSMLNTQPLQTLIALTGAGSNGKGCFTKMLEKFLGEDNCAHTELNKLLSRTFETSFLYKKLASFMNELNEDDMKNTALLKSLSGQDKIRFEFKGKGVFSDKSYATVIMSTNSLPLTPDKSSGYYRRWLVVDFPNTFPTGKDILQSIPEWEFENLARKLIRIAGELLNEEKFENNGSIEERMQRYEERANPVQKFIDNFYVQDLEGFVLQKVFTDDLNKWLPTQNQRQLSSKAIGNMLREIGYDIKPKKVALSGAESGNHAQYNAIFGIRKIEFGNLLTNVAR
jgi:P4 family phage/plasmid primase-like protien